MLRGRPQPDWMAEQPLLTPAHLLGAQLGLLDLGLLGALYLGWRLTAAVPGSGGTAARARVLLPWASVVAVVYGAGVWILLQPMQMRGMVGM